MSRTSYRVAVIGGALCWLLLGMHFPLVHEMVEHGQPPGLGAGLAVVLLIILCFVSLRALLRNPEG